VAFRISREARWGVLFAPPAAPSDFACREDRAHLPSPAGRDARLIPAQKTARIMCSPRPSKGRSREALRRRDGVRRPRASSQRGTRAAVELPPDPLGGPARSWLTARSARRCATDRTKAGPGAATAVIGAPRGARVPQGTTHKDFALFGAPSPQTPDAERAAAMPACAQRKHGQAPGIHIRLCPDRGGTMKARAEA
jgi:hypothetical protein